MQLSIAQKNFIEFVLSDFIEFSTDPAKLRDEIDALKTAFTTQVPREHPFYIAGDSLQDPCTRFQRLENQQQGTPISVGMVQTHIIEFTTLLIKEAALKAQIEVADLNWNHDDMIAQCVTEKNHQETFISRDKPRAPEPVWETIHPPGAIFDYRLEIEEIQIPAEPQAAAPDNNNHPLEADQPASLGSEPDYIPLSSSASESDFESDSDSDSSSNMSIESSEIDLPREYLGRLIITTYLTPTDTFQSQALLRVDGNDQFTVSTLFNVLAAIESRSQAIVTAIDYLLGKGILNLDFFIAYGFYDGSQYDFSFEEAILLTHRYYFDLVREKKLSVIELLQVTAEQTDILTHPGITFLLEKKIINIHQAKKLGNSKFQLLSTPAYHDLLLKNQLSFKLIDELSDEQIKLLIHPSVANLIRLEKLPFDLATTLPASAKEIFSNPNYMAFFMKNKTDWTLFSLFNDAHYKLLLHKSFVRACTEGRVSFSELFLFSETQLILLNTHPSLARWFCAGVLSHQEIKIPAHGTLLSLYSGILATRLNRVRIDAPCLIEETRDTAEKILSELPSIAKEAGLLEKIILNNILLEILNIIQADIMQRATCFPMMYNAFLEIIYRHNAPRDSFEDYLLLSDLLNKAKEIICFEINSVTLFRPTKRIRLNDYTQDEGVRAFCSQLLRLLPLKSAVLSQLDFTFSENQPYISVAHEL